MDQGDNVLLDQEKKRTVKSRWGVRERYCLPPTVFKTNSILQMKVLKDLKTSNIQRIQVICTVDYADDLVILAKEEMVLQGVSVRLKLEDAMEWKWIWKINMVMRICRQQSQIEIMIQGGSNMTGTDLCLNKPHCAAGVRPWESEATTSPLPPALVRTCSVLSGSC